MEVQELAWLERARAGDDVAFCRLVQAYQVPVYNLAYRMLGNAAEAEDAAQETFLRAYQHLHRYDQKRPFATWLLSIAAHYCIDRLRRRKFAMFSMDAEDEEGNSFELPDPESPDPETESVMGTMRVREKYRIEKTVPPEWVDPREPVRVTFEANPRWISPLDGAQLSFILYNAGFVP